MPDIARNSLPGDTKASMRAYRDNWDRVFGHPTREDILEDRWESHRATHPEEYRHSAVICDVCMSYARALGRHGS